MENYLTYFSAFIVGILVYNVIKQILPWILQVRKSNHALKPFRHIEPHWLWGHLKIHPGANEEGLMTNIKWLKMAPRAYTIHIGPVRPVLQLNHPDTVKQLLKSNEPKNTTGKGGYTLLKPWIGDGLLISKGAKWFRNRKLLTPGFHFDVLKPYVDIYNKSVDITLEQIEKQSHNGSNSVEIYNFISLLTLDIILKCAFSYDENIQTKSESNPYIQSVFSLSCLIVKRALTPLHYFDTLYYLLPDGREFKRGCDLSHDVASNVIQKRRDTLQTTTGKIAAKSRYVDFLDILLLAKDENEHGLTDAEIRDEVETFMFEGHDTTASGISWCLYNLARHAQYQNEAYEEIKEIIGDRNPSYVQWEDMPRFEYLTRCIKESLRLHPPVTTIGRELTNPMEIDGHKLPEQTIIDINIWNVHHNPTVWGPDVMTYDPNRFLQENFSKMDSYSFIPFSAGPRNCIGQHFAMNEMKCNIARILHRYEITLDKTHRVEMLPEIILKTTNGIKLHFKKRI